MPTPLDYARFGMSQDRYARQGEEFDQTMDFRQQQADRNYGLREQQFDATQDYRQQAAQRAERLAMLRMLPKMQRMQQAQGYFSQPEARDTQTEWNYAALPSWQAEKERSAQAGMSQPISPQQLAAWQRTPGKMGIYPNGETYMDGHRLTVEGIEGGQVNPTPETADVLRAGYMEEMQRRTAQSQGVTQGLQGDLQAEQQREQRMKAAKDRLSILKSSMGIDPGLLLSDSVYDSKTGIASMPGGVVEDDMGGFREKPGKKVPVPIALVNRAREDMAAVSGYGSYEELQMQDPVFAAKAQKQKLSATLDQTARQLGARPLVVERALALGKEMGIQDEAELIDLVRQLSQQDVQHQKSLTKTQAARQKAEFEQRRKGEAASAQWDAKPWYEKLPRFQGMTPIALP